MKKTLLVGFSLAVMATVAVAAEGRSVRSALPLSVGPALVGQVNSIPMPAPLSVAGGRSVVPSTSRAHQRIDPYR